MSLAIIPARGGSKRLPGKNIRLFHGKPIIGYAIDAALSCGCFSEVMVSTDCPKIAETALQWGASVPFLRSVSTSDDNTGIACVIREVLQTYAKSGRHFETACCLFATAALVRKERLQEAQRMLDSNSGTEGIITVVRTPQPATRCMVIRDSRVVFQSESMQYSRSQDLEETYFDAAQMYWVRTAPFLARELKTMASLKRLPLLLSELETQDINTIEDWRLAELKHQFLAEHPEIIPV
ncbi:N-acylneuraminate cytidylyltransferase [Prosthecobacter fusiformis]|uniref:N-acylneuraminate cytidylyltransferase n=1 Tax=Prosthecobacter fusiformis TaxID=48464 RepID=A0A4V3FF27_9BACT|nr:pseudaminic acid cytidylyltransferase [Prosthecobacter fusiformis]TDU69233.1 N-acylneuraminate cytidylyltransferase [Prosthecobacter fusiformis]